MAQKGAKRTNTITNTQSHWLSNNRQNTTANEIAYLFIFKPEGGIPHATI